tara:strand:- start:265 stop:420 length:156 start_codon:yes stop_codon:yes gene_type:complete
MTYSEIPELEDLDFLLFPFVLFFDLEDFSSADDEQQAAFSPVLLPEHDALS